MLIPSIPRVSACADGQAHGMHAWHQESMPHVDVEEGRVLAVHALRQQRGHLLYLVPLADEKHGSAPSCQGVGVVQKDRCLATAPSQYACK